jgi:hypothetical protein
VTCARSHIPAHSPRRFDETRGVGLDRLTTKPWARANALAVVAAVAAGADSPNVEVKPYRPQLSFALTVEFSVFKLTKAVLAFGPDTTGMT